MLAQPTSPARVIYRADYTPWNHCDPQRQSAVRQAWLAGELSYKISPAQRQVYDAIRTWESSRSRQGRTYVLDIGRRFGKSSIMVLMAFEDALRHPGWRIPYYGPTHKDLMKFITEHLTKLIADCPPEMRPVWRQVDTTYYFTNGSQVEFIGIDRNPNGARGGAFDKCFMDEAAFYDNLETIIQSVLVPQMLGRPWARLIAGSTPPESPAHYWSQAVLPKAQREHASITRTFDDTDIYTPAEMDEFIAEMGGRKAVRCRRELYAEHVTDETLAIIPEFREVEKEVVLERSPPYWRDCYVSLDPGWADHTAVLFGYWDFERGILYVEDEISAPRLNSSAIAELIKTKETALWGGKMCRDRSTRQNAYYEGRPQPYKRVSDRDPRLLHDLVMDHGLYFEQTQKDHLDQQINSLRNAVASKKIEIHPRCKVLVAQLKNGVWKNEARKVFAHIGDMGHFDTIAALVYLWRNVHKRRNPAPIAEKHIAGDLKAKDGPQESKWSRRGGRIWLRPTYKPRVQRA